MSDNIIEIVNKDYTFELLQNFYEISAENIFSIDYNLASNIPSINNIKLMGNKTLADLGIQASGSYANDDLNNLSTIGQAVLDNKLLKDLSNIDETGQAILNAKADKATTLDGYGITDGANTSATNFTAAGKSFLSKLALPSSKFINLVFGADSTNYIAPADGYFYALCTNSTNGFICIQLSNLDTDIADQKQLYTSYGTITILLPVFKNNSIVLNYSNGINCQIFRFIYAQGEK